MKKIYSLIIATAMLITTGIVNAVPITQTDTQIFNQNLVGNTAPNNTFSYSHLLSSFTDFDPLVDDLQSATLVLTFANESNSINVVIQGISQYNGSLAGIPASFSSPASISLGQFLTDEALAVSLTKTTGGGTSFFTFVSSELTLEWLDGTSNGDPGNGDPGNGDPTPIPEPGTVMLLAAGLLGLASLRRRRRSV